MKSAARITKRFIVASFAVLLMTSASMGCDAFLGSEPLGQATSENFFETPENAIQATNATYEMLRAWTVHVFAWIGMTDIVSDDATKGSTPTDAAFLLELDNLNFDPGNIAFSSVWEGYYQGIYRANTAILNIPNIEMEEDLKARLVAENKFLRAYFYFFLVRAFGGVPLITEPLEIGDEFERPRASAEEVYSLIEQDLADAIAALPEKSAYPASDMGRATKGAARALLAKAHLFQEEYAEAQQYAEEVINSGEYALEPDYSFIFRQEGENSSGSIFEVQTIALEEGGGGSQYGQVQGVRGTPNLGWGFNQPSDDLELAYEPGDPRQQATVLYPWELLPDGSGVVVQVNPNIQNQQYNEKVSPPLDFAGPGGDAPVNIRRIRYADVLLIAAEAAYRNGDMASAQAYLNQVRERAREGQDATVGLVIGRLADFIAVNNLGLSEGSSRAFIRYINEGGPASGSGLQPFASQLFTYEDESLTPVLVENIDLIQSVDGTAVTTPEDYEQAMQAVSPGQQVTLEVLRIAQQESGEGTAATSTETLQVTLAATELLPDVTTSGQALLEAIWHERRVELAMEQHRWFDIIRQGRAAEVMDDVGKNFQEHQRLYPIPQGEIDLSGGLIEQNPGYN